MTSLVYERKIGIAVIDTWDFLTYKTLFQLAKEGQTQGSVIAVYNASILVPRAHDPSGLRQESRALRATISGMRHRCRLRETGWAE